MHVCTTAKSEKMNSTAEENYWKLEYTKLLPETMYPFEGSYNLSPHDDVILLTPRENCSVLQPVVVVLPDAGHLVQRVHEPAHHVLLQRHVSLAE